MRKREYKGLDWGMAFLWAIVDLVCIALVVGVLLGVGYAAFVK